MKKSIKLIISGSVQPFFFKPFVKKEADKNNIRGHVRSLEDGRLEIFIEGDKENVDNMIEICKRGPTRSNLRYVEEKEEKFQDFKEFKIMGI